MFAAALLFIVLASQGLIILLTPAADLTRGAQ